MPNRAALATRRRACRATPGDLISNAKGNTTRAALDAGLEVTGGKSAFRAPRRPRVSKAVTVQQGTPRPALDAATLVIRRRAAIFGY